MKPLTSEQLRVQETFQVRAPAASPPKQTESSGSLYKDMPVSGPQLMLEATQALASEVIQTLSPRKQKESDPLIKSRESGRSGIMSFIPSYVTSLWSSEGEKAGLSGERIEVTRALQSGTATGSNYPATTPSNSSAEVTATTMAHGSTRKVPPTYGGAYAASPYHIPRPSHVGVNDFPSPSRTPYHPVSNRRRD